VIVVVNMSEWARQRGAESRGCVHRLDSCPVVGGVSRNRSKRSRERMLMDLILLRLIEDIATKVNR
jgi:hypothetical protein